jgi:threonine-phosphate decarboxylase
LKEKKFFVLSREKLISERRFLYERLTGINGVRPFPSAGNFIMAKIENGLYSGQLQMKLAKRGLLIRDCADFPGLSNKFFRVAVKGRADNLRFVRNLEIILKRR